ncbi:hypothetical protein PG997_001641 [Apiospora hydei]|uniref:Protein kinase domain-containing protein n=1 Tax=Apiospora hydei TaxID=1337664 RepID=A0ABR1XE28_9PEZI
MAFKDACFTDEFLPITSSNRHMITSLGHDNRDVSAPWSSAHAERFMEKQWEFLVRGISKSDLDWDLDPEHILPFRVVRDFSHGDSQGGSRLSGSPATVLKEYYPDAISPLRFQIGEEEEEKRDEDENAEESDVQEEEAQEKETQPVVAVKEYRRDVPRGKEVQALKKAKEMGARHCIELLAVITRGDMCYLVFPWADGGNLSEFWSSHPKPRMTAGLMRRVVRQLKGLTDALNTLHTSTDGSSCFHHGDLRAETILRFRTRPKTDREIDVGVMKIANFDLAQVENDSPEVRLTAVTGDPLLDIWSFGCVVIEFMIWILYGRTELDQFRYLRLNTLWENRSSARGGSSKTLVQPVLNRAMETILADQECQSQSAMRDLLRLVKNSLLAARLEEPHDVLHSIRSSSEIRPRKSDDEVPYGDNEVLSSRGHANTFRKALGTIQKRGRVAHYYWYTNLQRYDIQKRMFPLEGMTSNVKDMQSTENTVEIKGTKVNDQWFFPVDNDFVVESGLLYSEEAQFGSRTPPGETKRIPKDFQIGMPALADAGSSSHFAIIQSWLDSCTKSHADCATPIVRQRSGICVPSRLLDIGSDGDPTIKLLDISSTTWLRYIALSHPWGPGPHFCTLPSNLNGHKQGIADAVIVTRRLGISYLWIDSICIVQGPEGDFDTEADRMEYYFGNAWCVIVASSATSQTDGFLRPRTQQRDFVTVESHYKGRPRFHVCEFIDDFQKDVRGWVFQERALARRSIFFSEGQTYWECGHGVRCETMTKTSNLLASYMGDPNFPSRLADGVTRLETIRGYESLYSRYSRLALSRATDRPVAIRGLQRRLIRSLGVPGPFGVFDDRRSYLQHTLLWRRGRDVASLARVPGLVGRVPSWSWMAYGGGIDYLDLPRGGGVLWKAGQVEAPWRSDELDSRIALDVGTAPRDMELKAVARPFGLGFLGDSEPRRRPEIIYDDPGAGIRDPSRLRCVAMGREDVRGKAEADITHYVLVVQLTEGRLNMNDVYERVGAGYVDGCLIDWRESEMSWVTIC